MTYPYEKLNAMILWTIFQRYVLRKSWSSIASKYGFRYHTDYLHLNSAGAQVLAELISSHLTNWMENQPELLTK